MQKKTYIVGGALIALLIIVAVFMTSAPQEVQLTAADNGSIVKLKAGQIMSITLDANPTTGYTWEVAEPPSGQIMRQIGDIEFVPGQHDPEIVGAGGVQIIRFEIVNVGQTSLKLVYHRPWETDMEPLDTFSVQLIAR